MCIRIGREGNVRIRWVIIPFLASVLLLGFQAGDAVRIVESAKTLLQKRDWKAAAAEFERALKLAPKNVDAHIGLGVALWGAGDRQAALAAFRRAIEANPTSPEARYDVALALRDAGELDKAIAEMRAALKLRPEYDEARLAFGLMLQQQGDVAGAIAQHKLVLQHNPRSAEAHNWLGVAYMQKNQLAEAAAEFRAAIKLEPDFVRAYNNLGSTLAQAGDLQEGIDAFQTGLQHAPDDLPLHLNLGAALRTKGDAEGAIREFQIVLKRDPDNPEVHHQNGQALREKGDLDGAIREFETALALNPEYQEAYYILGQTLGQLAAARRSKTAVQPPNAQARDELKRASETLERGDPAGAVDWARKAAASDPNSAEVHNALGLALGRARELPGAIESFRRAIALRPDFADANFNLGAALWYSGEKMKAAAALDEALRLNPSAAEVCSLRGIAYRDAGDLASARRMLQRAVALNPKLPAGYFDLGVLFLRMQQLPHALGQFEAGLNLPGGPPPDLDVAIRDLRTAIADKQDADAHNTLGRLLGLAGADAVQVATELEAAVSIRTDYAEAHNNLGLVYTQIGDDEKAVAAFRAAIRHRPEYAEAHANLGAILTATDVAESVRELEKAIQLQPGLLKAHYNLAIAYGSSPNHGTAKEIEELRRLLALGANYPRADFSLGKALLRKGSVQEAIRHLERAVQMEPRFGEAHYQLGLALSRTGRTEDGTAEVQKGRELIAASQRDQIALLDMDEGKAALEKGEIDNAVVKFRQVLKERPGLAEAHYQLGVALARKGDSDGAASEFRKTLETNPDHAGAKTDLARLSRTQPADDPRRVAELESYFREGKFKEVQPLLEDYVKQLPNSSWGWYALGYSLFAQQKIGESIQALAKSLSLNVADAEAHKVLGRDLMIVGRFDAAQREFELGEKYDPRSAEMPFNLGRLFSIQDQWIDARAAFERALKIDPSYIEAYDGLGFAMEALGDDAAAIANYQKAVELNEQRKGNFAAPYVNLSALHNRTGNIDAALEYARKAVAVNAKADRGWFQLARAYERRGELEAAVDALGRALAINSRASTYYYVLGTLYRRLGKQQESRDALDMFAKLNRETNELEERRREGLRQAPGHD